MGAQPPPGGVLHWLRVRLAVGLGITDEGFAEFAARRGADEEQLWREVLAAADGSQAVLPFVSYFTVDGEATTAQGPRLRARHEAAGEWTAIGTTPAAIRHMLFYPRAMAGGREGAAAPAPHDSPDARRLSELYTHCGLTSDQPTLLMPRPGKGPALELCPDKAAVDDIDRVVAGWSVTIGRQLAQEAQRRVRPAALGEVEFWAERLAVTGELQRQFDSPEAAALLADLRAAGREVACPRWPAQRALLLAAHLEARRRASDSAVLCRALNALRNTLPRRLGSIAPLWDVVTPFYCALGLLSVSPRQPLPCSDLERIIAKTGAELCDKVAGYVDWKSLFTASETQLAPTANIELRPEPGAGRVREAPPLPCVEEGRRRCEESVALLREWRAMYDRTASCVAVTPHARAWQCETRRAFEAVSWATTVCDDLLRMLDDLDKDMPMVEEDMAGYQRLRALIALPLAIEFDCWDPGHGANWRLFLQRWTECVRNKVDVPQSLRAAPLELRPPVRVAPIDERLPVESVVKEVAPPAGDALLAKVEPAGTPEEKLRTLQQEKEILGARLLEARRLAEEDRGTIEALRGECERAWALVESLRSAQRTAGDRVG